MDHTAERQHGPQREFKVDRELVEERRRKLRFEIETAAGSMAIIVNSHTKSHRHHPRLSTPGGEQENRYENNRVQQTKRGVGEIRSNLRLEQRNESTENRVRYGDDDNPPFRIEKIFQIPIEGLTAVSPPRSRLIRCFRISPSFRTECNAYPE